MNESNELKTISEIQFKRLCGKVWAGSFSKFDVPVKPGPIAGKGGILLRQVLDLIRGQLELGHKASLTASGSEDYRKEIDVLMQRHAAAPFDHNRVIDRLLREVLTEQVA